MAETKHDSSEKSGSHTGGTEEGRGKGGQHSGGNFKNDPERAAEAGHRVASTSAATLRTTRNGPLRRVARVTEVHS